MASATSPLRIVQVSPFFHPHAGGVESHVRSISRELARQGHSVTVLTSRYRPELPATESFEGYRIVRSRPRRVWFNTPIDPDAGRVIRELPADIVHVHFPPPLTAYYVARALARRPVKMCLTYHCDLYLASPFGSLATAVYNRLFLPQTLQRADRIVTHTRSYALTSRGLGGREVEVIPSSVDLDRFRPEVDGTAIRARLDLGQRPVLAFTGRFVPHKGLDTLLRALARLPREVVLLAIGRGPDLPSLTALARRLGVLDRVRFCPAVSDLELPSYLRAADLFVFPSTNRLEGFGLAVAEAMASGLPVVVADMPGVRDIIEPGVQGLLAEPLLDRDLADRIQELLADPSLRDRMGKAGRRRAEERFEVGAVSRSLVRLYERLRAAG